jgi:hypothetical protein
MYSIEYKNVFISLAAISFGLYDHNLTNTTKNLKRLVVVVVLVVGPISTAAMKAYCTLTSIEFRHSSSEALHTKRRERPLLTKDGTKAK